MSNKVLATVLNNKDEEINVRNIENKQTNIITENRRQKYIKIMEDYNSGDEFKKKKAIDDMINNLSMYVYSVIAKYFPSYIKYKEDLYQEGCLAILKNLEKYDPNIAMPSTFFFIYIKDQINTFIVKNVNNTSRYCGNNMNKIKNAIKYYEMKNQNFSNEDIAEQTGLSIKQVVCTMNIMNNTEVVYDNTEEFENQLVGKSETPEQKVLDNEMNKNIVNLLYTLDDDERIIVMYRMGFMGKCMSFKNIAELLNTSMY